MFSLMKKIQFKHLCWVFAFVYMSFMACNSYASICFLPTGECTDDDMDIVTEDCIETWADDEKKCNGGDDEEDEVSCSSGYSKSGCTPSDVIKCSSENGKPECVKKECNTAKGWYSDCRASGKRQTCETSNGCYKVVNVECPTGTLANCPDSGGELVCKEVEGCFETQCNTAANWYESCQEDETTTCTEGQYGCYQVGIKEIVSKCDKADGMEFFATINECENGIDTCVFEDGCWVREYAKTKCTEDGQYSTQQKCLDAGNLTCVQVGDCWKGLGVIDGDWDVVTCEIGTYRTKTACETAMPGFVCNQLLNGCWMPASDTKEKCDGITTFSTITACREKNPGKTCALDNGCFKVKANTGCNEFMEFAVLEDCQSKFGVCIKLANGCYSEKALASKAKRCEYVQDAYVSVDSKVWCDEETKRHCMSHYNLSEGYHYCGGETCGTISWECKEETVTCLFMPHPPMTSNPWGYTATVAKSWAKCSDFNLTEK